MASSVLSRASFWLWCLLTLLPTPVTATQFSVQRLNQGEPIISALDFQRAGAPQQEGANINGPSVIRIPDWIPPQKRASPDAQFYLYFAHHHGDYIRMAWAESVEGPWQLYRTGEHAAHGERGVLDMGSDRRLVLDSGLVIASHIASPDVHVDEKNRQIVMYFHGRTTLPDSQFRRQQTYVATSPWGLDFTSGIQGFPLGDSYLRVFEYNDMLQGLTPKQFYHPSSTQAPWSSPGKWTPGEEGIWDAQETHFLKFNEAESPASDGRRSRKVYPRHLGLHRDENTLHVFFTMKGDSPERILVTTVDLARSNWFNVAPESGPAEVLRAQREWEGGRLVPRPSRRGAEMELVNALRDPFVFSDDDKMYLFYSGGGERAIGLARLTQIPDGP